MVSQLPQQPVGLDTTGESQDHTTDGEYRTNLRNVVLAGPVMATGEPMWLLTVGAPRGHQSSIDTYNHSIRTLAIDGETTAIVESSDGKFLSGAQSPQALRAPRLLDLHVIAGSTEEGIEQTDDVKEMVSVGPGKTINQASNKPVFRTTKPGFPNDATFNRVIAEPLRSKTKFKGDFVDQSNEDDLVIRMPWLRLVKGSICLSGTFAWLEKLVGETPAEIVLTSDGVIFKAKMELPGIVDKLEGGFLLAPASLPALKSQSKKPTGLALTLLPNHPATISQQALWNAAWKRLVGFASSGGPVGLNLRSRQGGVPPSFQWPLYHENGTLVPPGAAKELPPFAVDVPPRDLRVELLGSFEADGTPDGIAVLRAARVRLASNYAAGLIRGSEDIPEKSELSGVPGALDNPVQLVVEARVGEKETKKEKEELRWVWGKFEQKMPEGYWSANFGILNTRIGHDEYDLARKLRTAFGWAEPLRKPQTAVNAPRSFTVEHQPIAPGFAPVERGWMQIPFPNLPTINPEKDNELLKSQDQDIGSTLDGYIRVSSRGSKNLSTNVSAPWSMTVEGAPAALLFVGVGDDTKSGGASITAANLYLKNPKLSLSGLLWLSLDRPDATEALPRLSAGAGSLLDVRFATLNSAQASKRVVSGTLNTWSAEFSKTDSQLKEARLTLNFQTNASLWVNGPARTKAGQEALRAAWNVLRDDPWQIDAPWPSVYWKRHDSIPLAATMPMTRVAASAIQPLESRELAPFVVAPSGQIPGGPIVIAELSRTSDVSFLQPKLQTSGLAALWPKSKSGSYFDAAVPFAAFGCPGVEVLPQNNTGAWSEMLYCARYDIPCLDEAFATASLPPVAQGTTPIDDASQDNQSAATALDWAQIGRFWVEQARRRQLSLVAHSYITNASVVDKVAEFPDVKSLVVDASWSLKSRFVVTNTDYGRLYLEHSEGVEDLSGNKALKGLDSKVKVALGKTTVVGWSPATFEEGNFSFDNQGVGQKFDANQPLVREFRRGGGALGYVVSRRDALMIEHLGWRFWYKDVALELLTSDGSERFEYKSSEFVDFSAWESPTAAKEWRLFDQDDAFHDTLSFAGLKFEPLRLAQMKFNRTAAGGPSPSPSSFTIIGRVLLADDGSKLPTSGNLATLHFENSGDAYRLVAEEEEAKSFVFRFPSNGVTLSLKFFAKGGKLQVESDRITANFYGYDIDFSGPKCSVNSGDASSKDTKLVVSWSDTSKLEPLAGSALLKIKEITFQIKDGKLDALQRKMLASIRPEGAEGASVELQLGGEKESLNFMGLSFPVSNAYELPQALVVVQNAKSDGIANVDRTLLSLFPVSRLAFTFASRVERRLDAKKPNVLALTCGVCEGEFYNAQGGAPVLRWEIVAQSAAKSVWQGHMTVCTKLEKPSSIVWPKVSSQPKGKTFPQRSSLVKRDGSDSYADTATYHLDHHQLEFSLCGFTENKDWRMIKPWLLFAVTERTLKSGTSPVASWCGVEMVAIGPASALVPKASSGGKDGAAHTFAGRYRNDDQTMLQPGIGALSTVLRGSFGRFFADRFWAHKEHEIDPDFTLILGGINGVRNAADSQDFLRLPFLWLSDSSCRFSQSAIPKAGCNLAWADSGLATPLNMTHARPLAPASLREGSILEAIQQGTSLIDGATQRRLLQPAQVVEQYFSTLEPKGSDDLQTFPHWLSSIASLSKFLEGVDPSDTTQISMLSVVAGSLILPANDKHFKRSEGYAALLGPVSIREQDFREGPQEAELVAAGKTLKILNCSGSEKYARELAASVHASPVFAFLRSRNSESGHIEYDYVKLSTPLKREMPILRPALSDASQVQFADDGRGYAIEPGGDPERWLLPIVEFGTKSVRDVGDPSSGLAGLTRQYLLPRSAGGASDANMFGDALTWVTQKCTPVYLSLNIQDLYSPPIPWLQQAPPRTRLPVRIDLSQALGSADGGETHSTLQAFVPSAVGSTSLAARPGVVMVQRASLAASAGSMTAFDDAYPRFGRPAQAGSSFRRWMRTPRPGPTPENVGPESSGASVDRRVQASPLSPKRSVRFLAGPSDIIVGETGGHPWTATFVAAPLSDGLLFDDWDGRLRLRVEVLTRTPWGEDACPPNEAADFLARVLFPRVTVPGDKAKACATLTVGETNYSFSAIEILAHCQKTSEVDVVLYLDDQPSASGEARSAIAEAIESGISSVDLTLTVHPVDSNPTEQQPLPGIPTAKRVALSTATDGLPFGESRPPTTLRWRLPTVARSRGAFPILPRSLIFQDPAYDRDLASPPLMSVPREVPNENEPVSVVGRGRVLGMIYADRSRVNRRGSIFIMADLRFERPPPETFQTGGCRDGDFVKSSLQDQQLTLTILLISKRPGRKSRTLHFGPSGAIPIGFSKVYELRLEALVEENGSPAILEAGDVIQLSASVNEKTTSVLFVGDADNTVTIDFEHRCEFNALTVLITDKPVAEPPSALYAALLRRAVSISLPLYAQSPLPYRVDFRSLKSDFRSGLVRRSAFFVWSLPLSSDARNASAFIVKVERNGQMYLPEEAGDFEVLHLPEQPSL